MFNLKGIFLKCSKKNFKILNILSCLFADLCICAYLYVLYANPTVYKKIFNELGPTLKQVNPESAKLVADVRFQTEIIQLMVQTVISIICVYLLIHLLIYLCLFFEKKFAKSYLLVNLVWR